MNFAGTVPFYHKEQRSKQNPNWWKRYQFRRWSPMGFTKL